MVMVMAHRHKAVLLLLSWLFGCRLEGACALQTHVPGAKKAHALLQSGVSTPQHQDRRKVFARILTTTIGAIGCATKARAASPVANTKAPQLQSLESAATGLRNGEDVFSKRLNYPHPGLRQIASPVTGWGSDLEAVAEGLLANMETSATTAVQYGIDARLIVLRGDASPLPGSGPLILVNPNVLSRSSEDKMVQWREYCLVVGSDVVWPEGEAPSADAPSSTLPTGSRQQVLEVDVLRDAFVEIAAQDLTGKPVRRVLQGEASRAFQHELDHLNGILLVDHAAFEDLPPVVAFVEDQDHAARQKRAFARTVYQGNGPLYY